MNGIPLTIERHTSKQFTSSIWFNNVLNYALEYYQFLKLSIQLYILFLIIKFEEMYWKNEKKKAHYIRMASITTALSINQAFCTNSDRTKTILCI